MFLKLIRTIPVPTLVGFVISLIAVLIGWLFSMDATTVFLRLMFITWLFLCFGEYKPPAPNYVLILVYALLGHVPYLAVKFLL